MIFGSPGWELVDNTAGKRSDGYGVDHVYVPIPMGART